jgi:hypothetical protein
MIKGEHACDMYFARQGVGERDANACTNIQPHIWASRFYMGI